MADDTYTDHNSIDLGNAQQASMYVPPTVTVEQGTAEYYETEALKALDKASHSPAFELYALRAQVMSNMAISTRLSEVSERLEDLYNRDWPGDRPAR